MARSRLNWTMSSMLSGILEAKFQLIQLQAKQAIVRLSPAAPIAWSPDSKKVAFVAENDSNSVDGTSVWIAGSISGCPDAAC